MKNYVWVNGIETENALVSEKSVLVSEKNVLVSEKNALVSEIEIGSALVNEKNEYNALESVKNETYVVDYEMHLQPEVVEEEVCFFQKVCSPLEVEEVGRF